MATEGFDEVSVNVVDACAGPDRERVSVVSSPGPCRLTIAGEREADVPTVTAVEAGLRPVDIAEMVVVPEVIPFSTTVRLGVV